MNQYLSKLKDICIFELKKSFEDEGSPACEVAYFSNLAYENDVFLTVKIGGPEARSDVNFCRDLAYPTTIVAPMIETPFALQKFLEMFTSADEGEIFINIESQTATKNLKSILDYDVVHGGRLAGIVIGRTDLTKSFGLTGEYTDSVLIQNEVEEAARLAKDYSLQVGIGGNMNSESIDFIEKLAYEYNVLDFIETRNVKIYLNDIDDIAEGIETALLFELVELKKDELKNESRIKDLEKRIHS